jgi:hypothetical protein
MVTRIEPNRKGATMENDENRDPQTTDETTEDLEVTTDEAEGVAGGARKNDPDARGQYP